MKYMVMECHPAYAVVLGDDGSFRKVANLRYEVGQTVEQVEELARPAPARSRAARWVPVLVAAAACLSLVLGGWLMNFRAYASVYISINPEVRIDVNRRDLVVRVEGINDDGRALVQGYAHQNRDLDTVTEELIDRAIDQGYLHQGGTITLTLDAEEQWVTEHQQGLNDRLHQHLTDRLQVVVDITHKDHAEHPPVTYPRDSGYGDTDYGNTDYGPTQPQGDSGYRDSGYGGQTDTPCQVPDATDGDTDYGVSDYQEHTDPATDYEDTDYGPGSDGVTDYEDTDYGPGSDGVTDYEDTDYGSDPDGQTDYGDTDYGAREDGDTEYR